MEGQLEQLDPLDSRHFLIAVKRLANDLSYGTDSSPFRGSGVEYVQSRLYQTGDPVRAIDWRVTARTRKVFIKEYESPKRMPVYLLIDTSASMTVSSVSRSKYATALHIAGGLALACLERISPVGVVGVGQRDFRVRPGLSRHQILQWLLLLRRFRYDESTSLARRLAEITPTLRHRVLMIVLSDLHDDGALPALKRLVQLHDAAVLQLRDPAEDGLRGGGLVRAREAETGREFVTPGRRRHLDQALLEQDLKRSGIDHLLIRTNLPFVHALRHFLANRGLLGRGAR
ncbi:MAG: DUF58 domain-containing protein [Planctomycetota bacterium]